jgi:hypothetical protein
VVLAASCAASAEGKRPLLSIFPRRDKKAKRRRRESKLGVNCFATLGHEEEEEEEEVEDEEDAFVTEDDDKS